jgi:hypothetical protein
MIPIRLLSLAFTTLLASFLLSSCETLEKEGPKPPTQKLSSIPHNMPAAWEGQAGMPGMLGGQY